MLQQTRSRARRSPRAPVAEARRGTSAGWHATDPLSAAQSSPVCGHSRTQCGPPTSVAVPSSRTSIVGTSITCLIFIVAASTSSSVFDHCSETHRWPGREGESERLCSPLSPSPLASVGPTRQASWSSSSSPPGPTGILTSTELDI